MVVEERRVRDGVRVLILWEGAPWMWMMAVEARTWWCVDDGAMEVKASTLLITRQAARKQTRLLLCNVIFVGRSLVG